MRIWHQGNQTAVILLHEIYGVNGHMKRMGDMLVGWDMDVWCPDLLRQTDGYPYEEAESAYNHYRQLDETEDWEAYVKLLGQALKPQYERLFLLGFSAGGTLAWRCSRQDGLWTGVAGYYGSRIRCYEDVKPACPVLLIFPKEEDGFDVNELAGRLSGIPKVKVYSLPAFHGFADEKNGNYDKDAAQEAQAYLQKFFR